MNPEKSAAEPKVRKRRGRRPAPKIEDGSREAKRIATAVLEVLAGTRTPGDAAAVLGIGLPRYYALETAAIAGLVTACEPKYGGNAPTTDAELAALKKVHAKLERECARQQALVRITQRSIGLAAPAVSKPGGKSKKERKPRVRALRAIAAIGSTHEERPQTAGHETRGSSGRVGAGEAPASGDSRTDRG